MFQKIVNKVKNVKQVVTVTALMTMSDLALAQNGQGADANFNKVGTAMNAFLKLLPIASKIAGIIIMIGGLWAMYSHYKSGGRDGSIPAGIAGLVIGAALFFLSGLLAFGADATGISQTGGPQIGN